MTSFVVFVALCTTLLCIQDVSGLKGDVIKFEVDKISPDNPRVVAFKYGPKADHVLDLKATMTGNRFTIDFKYNQFTFGNIDYHFDVRKHYGNSKNKIVQNLRKDGKWGSEENIQYNDATFPFKKDKQFHLIVKRSTLDIPPPENADYFREEFKVYVDGDEITVYKGRIVNFELRYALISGDLVINSVSAK